MNAVESNQLHSAVAGTPLNLAKRPPSALDRIGGDHIDSLAWYEGGLLAAHPDDPKVVWLRGAHAALHKGFAAIREALLVKDPQLTPEAHLLAVRRNADKWLPSVVTRIREAGEAADAEVKAIDLAIRARVGTPTQHASEIRAYLRSLGDEERHGVMETATKAGDTATVAAMLDAPAYLSGLNEKQQDAFRRLYLDLHAKDLLDRKEAIQFGMKVNEGALQEAAAGLNKFFDAKTIAKIVSDTNKAEAARDAIAQSLAL